MRSIILFLALILLPLPCYTQDQTLREKGDIKDVASLSKAYLSADSTIARKLILKELKGYKNIIVVSSLDEAEFFIEYKVLKRNPGGAGIFGISGPSTISEMVVYTPSNKGRRVAWSKIWTDDRFGERNEIILTRGFIKALKKASGTK